MSLMAIPAQRTHPLDALYKQAAGDYDMQRFGAQSYVPNLDKRELSPEEQEAVDKGKKRWLPKIFQSYKTPMPEMMASPGKQGLVAGGAGALGGGAIGGLLGHGLSDGGAAGTIGGTGIGALLGALGMGIPAYFDRKAKNENIEDIMVRSPEGGTKRDYMADSAVQADTDRRQSGQNAGLLAAALLSKHGEAHPLDFLRKSAFQFPDGRVGAKLKDDHYAQGQDAWDSVGSYLKGNKDKDPSAYDPTKNAGPLGKVS